MTRFPTPVALKFREHSEVVLGFGGGVGRHEEESPVLSNTR